MKRYTKRGPRALRVVVRDDRRAIERAVKDMFATEGQLMLPILSRVTEARVHIELRLPLLAPLNCTFWFVRS